MTVHLPAGLTLDAAHCYRRRERAGVPVDETEALQEVARLFESYASRAKDATGRLDLKRALDDWDERYRAAAPPSDLLDSLTRPDGDTRKHEAYSEALAAAERAAERFGLHSLVSNAAPHVDGALVPGGEWTVCVTERPYDAAVIVTLWHMGLREPGRCIQGDWTWREAITRLEDGQRTYRALLDQRADEIEEAGLHRDVIAHVLNLHDRGELPLTSLSNPERLINDSERLKYIADVLFPRYYPSGGWPAVAESFRAEWRAAGLGEKMPYKNGDSEEIGRKVRAFDKRRKGKG